MFRTLIVVGLVLIGLTQRGAAGAASWTHSFLVTGAETYILEFKPTGPSEGTVVWRYPASTRDGYVLPSGDVLLTLTRSQAEPGGAVVEVTRDNKVTYRHKGTQEEVNSAQPLPGGGIVLTEAGPKPRLLELDAAGKVVVEFPLACQLQNAHMQTRMARKLADGTYLVPHLFDFAVKQYDKTGRVLKVFNTAVEGDANRDIHSWPFTAIRLPDGNTLCGLTHSNRVVEFDPEGKIVWQLTNEDLPAEYALRDACGVQRLPNGNIVITSYAAGVAGTKLIEVTREKKVVWSYKNAAKHGIHHFQILDTDGRAIAGEPMK